MFLAENYFFFEVQFIVNKPGWSTYHLEVRYYDISCFNNFLTRLWEITLKHCFFFYRCWQIFIERETVEYWWKCSWVWNYSSKISSYNYIFVFVLFFKSKKQILNLFLNMLWMSHIIETNVEKNLFTRC